MEKIITENFLKLEREKKHASSGTTKSPNHDEPKEANSKTYHINIIIKLPSIKDKGRNLKAARQKQEVTYKWAPIRLAANSSTETLQSRR